MAVVKELLRVEENGTISFGNHLLSEKTKLEDFEYKGNLYKIKTFEEITKLEKNGKFLYESVPGTSVKFFDETENGISFIVEGKEDAQITVEMEEGTQYRVVIAEEDTGVMKTNVSGKLSFSVELGDASEVMVRIVK